MRHIPVVAGRREVQRGDAEVCLGPHVGPCVGFMGRLQAFWGGARVIGGSEAVSQGSFNVV